MIRILAAEHSPHFLEILATLMDGQPGLDLVATSSDGLETVEKTTELRPDLVIMDVPLPRLSGPEATRRIKQGDSGVCVLLFGSSPGDIAAGLAAGATATCQKTAPTKNCSKRSDESDQMTLRICRGPETPNQLLTGTLPQK